MSVKQTELTIFSSSFRAAQPLACALFEAAIERGKVVNAYLLVGRAVDDKHILARQLACFLNCEKIKTKETGGSCAALANASTGCPTTGWCLNCQWIWGDSHPQAWLFLRGEGKTNRIPVENVRDLTEELGKTSTFARVIVVPQSDEVTFHRPAANALLKSIEEPPDNCLFLFFADSTDDVLATIVSRCQVVPVAKALQLGHWMHGSDGNQVLPADIKGKLEAARSAFILNARRYTARAGTAGGASALKVTTDGLDLSRQLLDLSKELGESMEEKAAIEQILDLVVASELEVHREEACQNAARSAYLSRVIDLAEQAKRQINAFVKPTNAIESFSLSLNEIRHAYSGESSLAKR